MKSIFSSRKTIFTLLIIIVLLMLYIFMPYEILMEPLMTPAEYLSLKPYVTLFNSLTIIVPSSTIIVYLLGVVILWIGIRLIKNDKKLWGLSMLFWAAGTFLAGTSYQGLGFELKCSGFDYCIFTSWFELAYLFVTAISMSLLAIAFSNDLYNRGKNNWLVMYSKIAIPVYAIILVLGSILKSYIMISYELFTVFFMPIFLVLFVINIINYHKKKDSVNKSFIILWIIFLVVNVLYYVCYLSGINTLLYDNTGIWFSSNDVLHVGLILWFIYFNYKIVPKLIKLK